MKLKTKLNKLLEQEESCNSLRTYVIDYILEQYETDQEIKNFFNDLSIAGCQSGMVSSLVYYSDTKAFYDEYYDEIEEMRIDLESQGIATKVKGNLKNFYAWMAFEETAYKIAEELGLND